MTLTRRNLLAGSLAAKGSRKTNVVMFMTDDHGAWTLGTYGCGEAHTPNLDRLAREGAKFTRAYACTPVCSPSRMSYMTGKLPCQHGVQDYLLPDDSFGARTIRFLDGHTTYAEVLASHGYKLGMCGKWHMGDDERAQRGFTYWHTVPGGGGTYRDPEFVTNGVRRKLTGFKTDLVTDGAIEFLDQAKDGPFYLLVPFYAPHTPYDFQPDTYRKPYLASKFSCYPDETMHPWQINSLTRHHGNRESQLSYSALINGVDTNVGRVLRKLEQIGVRDNTLVVFTADQGWNAGHHGVWGKGNGTWPFNLYEESIRVRIIWNHPGRIRGGQSLSPMISSYDYFPSLLDYLGVPAHKDSKLPGRSYAGFLSGRPPKWRDRLYFEYSYVRGLRTETLKYIERTKEWPSELYDLEADPGEKRNVIGEAGYQNILRGLRSELGGFFESSGAPAIEEWQSTTRQKLAVYKRHHP